MTFLDNRDLSASAEVLSLLNALLEDSINRTYRICFIFSSLGAAHKISHVMIRNLRKLCT